MKLRRLIIAAALAAVFIVPTPVGAIDPAIPGSVQEAALSNPDSVYMPASGNSCGIEFTANLARQWWKVWFAGPVDLADVRPGLMPGALVLTAEEYATAVTLNARGNTLSDAPRNYNPLNLPVTPGVVGADGVEFCPTDSYTRQVSVAPTTSRYAEAITKLQKYIDKLAASGNDPAKLARYQARLADYIRRNQ